MNRPAHWSGAWDWGAYPADDAEMGDFQLAKTAATALQEDFGKPFFMSVGFFRPHVPLFVPPRWFDLYDAEEIVLPENPKSDLDDLPPNFLSINNYAVAPTHAEVIKHGKRRSLTHAYLASISFVDNCVGIVVDALATSPHADNTIIVLWSDHGFHLGEKQHWAKRTLWEESTRVPLLFVGPEIEPGEACREPASLIDIYPTLVEMCGLPANRHLEGVSLLPQLKDPATAREQPAITSSYFGNHSVRSRDWRLVVYEDGSRNSTIIATTPMSSTISQAIQPTSRYEINSPIGYPKIRRLSSRKRLSECVTVKNNAATRSREHAFPPSGDGGCLFETKSI